MPTYETPGVYIEEVTGPGVIVGVGTSTAAFIGPTAQGPLLTPTVITTFDDYKRIFGRASDGWPYLVTSSGKRFYMGHGVQGFFENGGTRAVIVRVGSATTATWTVKNGAGEEIFTLEALAEGEVGNGYKVAVAKSGLADAVTPKLAYVAARFATNSASNKPNEVEVTYEGSSTGRFIVGDTVAFIDDGGVVVGRSRVVGVSGTNNASVGTVTLESIPTSLPAKGKLVMAQIGATQLQIRLQSPSSHIQAGSLVQIEQEGNKYYSIVDRTDAYGFVFLRAAFQQENGSKISSIDISTSPPLRSLDFKVTVADADGKPLDEQEGLSLDPFHGGYIFRRDFQSVRVRVPKAAPSTAIFSKLQPDSTLTLGAPAVSDNPSGVGPEDYQKALDALMDVDDVNIVCVPDAADFANESSSPVQLAVIAHCWKKKGRIAVLDVPRGRSPANAASHRDRVTDSNGLAALYYPWLLIPEPLAPGLPRPAVPQSIPVPPSGHIAGVYARVDQSLGVHHAPANTEVTGVVGLERLISDREQALINPKGVNALRIFPGNGRVLVWGARTTVPQEGSDWTYVNVRRLMLYIEESIERGIRWAVFKPNERSLWQSLKRTISDFLERVYRDGGLAGRTREQAYQVRIDEGLNPPADIAKGRLYIEVKVAPVRPAEFIIVRIGLWDGGAEVVET